MSDPVSTSRAAREGLARGLNALQADPSVPGHLVDLAAPIAQAMGALHQLERTQQIAPHAEVALGHLRGALARLQAAGNAHPAVSTALDHVAKSLSLVHAVSRMGAPAAQPPPPPPPPQPFIAPPPMNPPAPMPPQQPPPMRPPTGGMQQPSFPQPPQQSFGGPVPALGPPPPVGPPPVPMGGPHTGGHPMAGPHTGGHPMAGPPMGGPHTGGHPMGGPPPPMGGPPPNQGFNQGPMVARDPFAAPGPPPAPQGNPATPSMPVPAPPPNTNAQLVTADLGAHSPTNFYKGLSGNDVVDHGGLFVSTYLSPKLGAPVRLKVSLPGGYEFEANAVVAWTREQGGDAPPGFGARFTAITPEARQLIYRYVRNREPLFHDDL